MQREAEASSAQCPGVLLVEDDPDIRETVRDLLLDEGYDVRTAVNGKHGLELLEQSRSACLILLDMMMPVLDGAGFLAELRQRQWGELPVVVVSAVDARAQPGIVGFIRKPIDLDHLLGTVQRYCRRSEEDLAPPDEPLPSEA